MACKCGECRILYERVLMFFPADVRAAANHIVNTNDVVPRPVFLGWFTRPESTEHRPLFLFKCRKCQDVIHEFACYDRTQEQPYVHFHCRACPDEENILVDQKFYYKLGLPNPSADLEGFVERLKIPICPQAAGSHP